MEPEDSANRYWEGRWRTEKAEIERLTADLDNSNTLLDDCRRERNMLQKICAERSDEIERLRQERLDLTIQVTAESEDNALLREALAKYADPNFNGHNGSHEHAARVLAARTFEQSAPAKEG